MLEFSERRRSLFLSWQSARRVLATLTEHKTWELSTSLARQAAHAPLLIILRRQTAIHVHAVAAREAATKLSRMIYSRSLRNPRWPGILLCLVSGCSLGHFRQRSAAELLANPHYAWLTDSTPHARIHYLAGTPAADSLVRLRRDIETSWATAAKFVGGTPVDRAIDVFAVPTRAMVGEVAGMSVLTNALNFWEQRVVVVWIAPRGWPGPHEFVHIMAYDAWGTAKDWWLGEGVAVAAGQWAGVELDAYTKCLSTTGKLMPLGVIVPGLRNPDERTSRVAYPETGSFVRFLIRRYGREKVAQMYATGAPLSTIYGKSFANLEAEWRQHLESVDSAGTSCPIA